MSIYSYLTVDHQKSKDLMAQISAFGEKDSQKRDELFMALRHDLVLHAKTEELAFYDPLKAFESTKHKVEHGEDEHQGIEDLLTELSQSNLNAKEWKNKFNQLRQAVEHHIREEEQDIFSRARNVLSDAVAQEMEYEMKALKNEHQQELFNSY